MAGPQTPHRPAVISDAKSGQPAEACTGHLGGMEVISSRRVDIFRAVDENDAGALKSLLRSTPDAQEALLTRGANGFTPLHAAASMNSEEMIKAIAQASTDPLQLLQARARDGHTPLHVAANANNGMAIRVLISYAPSPYHVVEMTDESGMTPLLLAFLTGSPDSASELIVAGANVDARAACGNTAGSDMWQHLEWGLEREIHQHSQKTFKLQLQPQASAKLMASTPRR